MKKVSLAVLVALLLAGCGSGGTRAAAPVVSANSLDGATDVATNSSFVYTFSRAVNPATVNSSTYYIVPAIVGNVASPQKGEATSCSSSESTTGTVRTIGRSSTLTLGNPLTGGCDYILNMNADATPFQASFRTAGTTPPSDITATLSPSTGETNQALDVAVTAVFSSAPTVEPSTTTFTLIKDIAGATSECSTVTYDPNALPLPTATCTHAALSASSSYTAAITGLTGVTDATSTFTTAAAEAVTVTPSPADTATGKLLTVPVTITFSGAITESTLSTDTFRLKKNNTGSTLCTSVTYDSTTKVATCEHDSFEIGTSYTIRVTGVTDSNGNAIADTTATFTTSDTFGAVGQGGDMYLYTISPSTSTSGEMVFTVLAASMDVTCNYTKSGNSYTFTGTSCPSGAYISDDFAVMKENDTRVNFGVMIDPTKEDVDYMIGNSYGAQTFSSAYTIGYMNEIAGATGDVTVNASSAYNSAMAATGVNGVTVDGYNAGFNANYYFAQTSTGQVRILKMFENEDGYSVTDVFESNGTTFNSIFMGNENPADNTIPSDIALDAVYHGYGYYVGDIAPAGTLTITVKSTTTNSLTVDIDEFGPMTDAQFVPVPTTDWPNGFYYYDAGGGDILVMRLFGSKGILVTDNGHHGFYGLAVK